MRKYLAIILVTLTLFGLPWAGADPLPELEFNFKSFGVGDVYSASNDGTEADKCNLLRSIAKVKSKYICDRQEYLFFGPDTGHDYDARLARQGDLKIASFNLLHLGNLIAPFKQLDLIAEIMNQWDIVAALELKTLPRSSLIFSHNQRMLDRLDEIQNQMNRSQSPAQRDDLLSERKKIYESYVFPGYLQLLFSLKELDPSWSLILTAEGQGQGSQLELSGFYFRGSRVRSISTRACNHGRWGARACVMDVAAGDRDLISRPPFIAGFQFGDDKYTLYANTPDLTLIPMKPIPVPSVGWIKSFEKLVMRD
ncbi:MAG: hypothetical protein R2827_09910 [Bdellovibrionales bacterium]